MYNEFRDRLIESRLRYLLARKFSFTQMDNNLSCLDISWDDKIEIVRDSLWLTGYVDGKGSFIFNHTSSSLGMEFKVRDNNFTKLKIISQALGNVGYVFSESNTKHVLRFKSIPHLKTFLYHVKPEYMVSQERATCVLYFREILRMVELKYNWKRFIGRRPGALERYQEFYALSNDFKVFLNKTRLNE